MPTIPARGTLLLKEIDRLAHLLRLLVLGTNKRKRRFAEVIDLIMAQAPVKAPEPPFKLSREEMRNVGYHLRTPYKRDQEVCKLLLLRLNDEMTRSTDAARSGATTASSTCCRSGRARRASGAAGSPTPRSARRAPRASAISSW